MKTACRSSSGDIILMTQTKKKAVKLRLSFKMQGEMSKKSHNAIFIIP